MRYLKAVCLSLTLVFYCSPAFSQRINVCINVRGSTGIENELKGILSEDFGSFDSVTVVDSKEECHLYLDCALVEQKPIRLYGLGVSIAYRVRGDLYSRPTADVAQFGIERMRDVCAYLTAEIDKGFLRPLREPASP